MNLLCIDDCCLEALREIRIIQSTKKQEGITHLE